MDKRKISLIIIFIFFFSAVLTLIFSGLSMAKAVSLQNDVSVLFFQDLQSKEIFSAMLSSLIFAFQSAILPLLPFMIFSSLGFLSILYFKPDTKYLVVVLTAVLISSILIKFSIALAIICLGFFPSALLLKNMKEKKTAFRTASAFISSCIRWQNIFIATAVFFGIFLMPNFEAVAQQGMLSSVSALLPQDMQAAQTQAVRTLVDQCTLSAKNIVENEYIKSGTPQCDEFRNNIQSSLDSYKAQATAQIENATAQQLELPQFGFLSAFTKTVPLTSAIAVLFLLELLKPLFASLFSLIYSFAIRK